MIPKGMFFCPTCGENRYGDANGYDVDRQANLISLYWLCCSCDEQTTEKIPFISDPHAPVSTAYPKSRH